MTKHEHLSRFPCYWIFHIIHPCTHPLVQDLVVKYLVSEILDVEVVTVVDHVVEFLKFVKVLVI